MPTYFNRSRQVNRTPESEFRDACLKWLKLRFGPKMFHERNHQSMGSTPGRPDDQFLFKSHMKQLFLAKIATLESSNMSLSNMWNEFKSFVESLEFDPIPVYLEFKAPNGRIGQRQIQYHDSLRAFPARIHVVRTFDELEEAVADFQPSQLRMRR